MAAEASQVIGDLGIPTLCVDLGTIGGANIDLTSVIAPMARRLYFGVGGTVYLKMSRNSSYVPYVVQAGQYLNGSWVSVGGSGAGTTITSGIVAEQ